MQLSPPFEDLRLEQRVGVRSRQVERLIVVAVRRLPARLRGRDAGEQAQRVGPPKLIADPHERLQRMLRLRAGIRVVAPAVRDLGAPDPSHRRQPLVAQLTGAAKRDLVGAIRLGPAAQVPVYDPQVVSCLREPDQEAYLLVCRK